MLKIYYTDISKLANETIITEEVKKLNMQRRTKVLRCKALMDKARSLGAGLLFEYAISQQGYKSDEIEIETDSFGKPHIKGDSSLFFNLSHSGKYAAIAISDKEVGIDIETLGHRFDGEKGEKRLYGVINKAFSKEELNYIKDSDSSDRYMNFLRIWTRKEAFVKCRGCGIACDLTQVDTIKENYVFSKAIDEDTYMSVFSPLVTDNIALTKVDMLKLTMEA